MSRALLTTRRFGRKQFGASLVEFSIIAPVMGLMGLGTLQAGLLYHSKTILNYATYEAARVGATRHAQVEPMRKELGIRLAPLIGGDGSMEKAASAMARSLIEVDSPVGLTGDIAPPAKLEILSPNVDTFNVWGEPSLEYENQRVIPNSHLKHQTNEERGGLTLVEANLLKIEVTYGVELKIPLVGPLLLKAMTALSAADDERRIYYLSGRFPLKSSATVRMQSEAWLDAITEANAMPYGKSISSLQEVAQNLIAPGEEGQGADQTNNLLDNSTNCNANGLPMSSPLEVQAAPMACLASVNNAAGGIGSC